MTTSRQCVRRFRRRQKSLPRHRGGGLSAGYNFSCKPGDYAAYQRFANHPNFKKKGVNEPCYFVRNGAKQPVVCERHRIKIPGLGWAALKEYGYFPTEAGSISLHAGRFFCSVLVEVPDAEPVKPETEGLGVDFGIKSFAVVSDGREFPNVNRTRKVRKLEKKLKREQRRLSRKRESQKKNSSSKRYQKQGVSQI